MNRIRIAGLGLACLAFPLFVGESRWLHAGIISMVGVMAATSNRLPYLAGVWNIGQAGFMAIGAYTLFALTAIAGLPYWLSFAAVALIAAVVGAAVGLLASRVGAIYFALLTIMFVEVVRLSIINMPALGGHRTLAVPRPDPIMGLEFGTRMSFFYLGFVLTTVILYVLYRLEHSDFGEILNSISQSDELAKSIGINVNNYRVYGLTISSLIGGLTGAFFASYITVIGPTVFDLSRSITIWFYMIVGGIGHFWGPVVGAVFLIFMPEVIAAPAAYQHLAYSVITLLVIFAFPGGLISGYRASVGLVSSVMERMRRTKTMGEEDVRDDAPAS